MVDILKLRKMQKDKDTLSITQPESVKENIKDQQATGQVTVKTEIETSKSTSNPDSTEKKEESVEINKEESQSDAKKPSIKELLAAKKAEKIMESETAAEAVDSSEKSAEVRSPKVAPEKRTKNGQQESVSVDHKTNETNIEKSAEESEQGEEICLVTFNLNDLKFGVDINCVQEVVRFTDITRVPNVAHYFRGVVNLRGNITAVIDLNRRLELEENDRNKDTRIVVAETNGYPVGFMVDSVSDILHTPAKSIMPAPPVVSGIDAKYIRGIVNSNTTKRNNHNSLIICLDFESILHGAETLNLKEAVV